MKTKNRKMNEPHKFFLNFSQRLDLNSSNKHAALKNIFIYYTWIDTTKHYENNKLEIID